MVLELEILAVPTIKIAPSEVTGIRAHEVRELKRDVLRRVLGRENELFP